MVFAEINPFVRFAGNITYHRAEEVCAYDSRLILLLSDGLTLMLNGEEYNLSKGDLAYWPPGTPYAFLYPESFMISVIDFDFVNSFSRMNTSIPRSGKEEFDNEKIYFEHFSDATFFNAPFVIKSADFASEGVFEMVREFSTKTLYYREKMSGQLKILLSEIGKSVSSGSKKSFEATEKIIKYIEEHYSEKITNSELSDLVSYHEYHINRLMKAHTGQSLHEYLMRYRISVAKKLLLSGEMQITEIAEKTGFDSSAHFSSVFKKITGVTPLAYRKNRIL